MERAVGCQVQATESETCIRISGAIGASDIDGLARHLVDALQAGRTVKLDLEELVVVNAAFLQMLVGARASAEATGVQLSVERFGYGLERAAYACGLAHLLELPWISGAEQVQYFFFEDAV